MTDQIEGPEDAVRRVAEADDPGSLKTDDVISATDWFLSQDVEPLPADAFELNVSGTKAKKWVRFEIEAVGRDLMQRIRRDSADEEGMEDEAKGNAYLAIQGLTSPDLSDERQRGGLADPYDALMRMLGHKPLLIDVIARRILQISGGDMEDVRAATKKKPQTGAVDAAAEVAGAGN